MSMVICPGCDTRVPSWLETCTRCSYRLTDADRAGGTPSGSFPTVPPADRPSLFKAPPPVDVPQLFGGPDDPVRPPSPAAPPPVSAPPAYSPPAFRPPDDPFWTRSGPAEEVPPRFASPLPVEEPPPAYHPPPAYQPPPFLASPWPDDEPPARPAYEPPPFHASPPASAPPASSPPYWADEPGYRDTRPAGWSDTERARGFGAPSGGWAVVDTPDVRRPAPPVRERPKQPARSGWLLPILVLVLALAAGAGGAWYFLAGRAHNTPTGTGAPPTQAGFPTAPDTATAPDTTAPPTGTPSSAPVDRHAAEYDQLSLIERVLNESVSSRTELNRALNDAQNCTNLASALSQARDVVQQRSDEETKARAADLTYVPDGEALRADLIAVLQASRSADVAYLQYVQAVHDHGCRAGSSAYDRGNSLSQTAVEAKRTFLDAWTPLARQFGLTPHTIDDI